MDVVPRKKLGAAGAPIVDTWWQTETGGIMMSPMPGITATKPGSCMAPLPAVSPRIVNELGDPVIDTSGGKLCIDQPWPGMLRGVYGDRQRFVDQYFADVPGMYLTGDNARRDEDGDYWIMGRIDDVINVSGHRLSTIEVESALVAHPSVCEAAVVGRPHELKGQAIAAFVTLNDGEPGDEMIAELKQHVRNQIGALAQPEDIRFTSSLPKTAIRQNHAAIVAGCCRGTRPIQGDTSTLEDFASIAKLQDEKK